MDLTVMSLTDEFDGDRFFKNNILIDDSIIFFILHKTISCDFNYG